MRYLLDPMGVDGAKQALRSLGRMLLNHIGI